MRRIMNDSSECLQLNTWVSKNWTVASGWHGKVQINKVQHLALILELLTHRFHTFSHKMGSANTRASHSHCWMMMTWSKHVECFLVMGISNGWKMRKSKVVWLVCFLCTLVTNYTTAPGFWSNPVPLRADTQTRSKVKCKRKARDLNAPNPPSAFKP